MSGNGSSRSLSLFVLASLLALGVFMCSAPGVSADPSQTQGTLWQTLKASIDSLPQAMLNYNQSLQTRITNLQTSNSDLTKQLETVQVSNRRLQTSLESSQAQVSTSIAELSQLQKDLMNSTQSIKKAQAQAQVLEAQNHLLKVAIIITGAVIVAAAGYEGGSALHLW